VNAASSESTIYDAKTHLSQLVARAEDGQETVLTRHGRPVALVAPLDRSRPARAPEGQAAGAPWQTGRPESPPYADLLDWYDHGPKVPDNFMRRQDQPPAEERDWW
jgi:prevent-host-death family protein